MSIHQPTPQQPPEPSARSADSPSQQLTAQSSTLSPQQSQVDPDEPPAPHPFCGDGAEGDIESTSSPDTVVEEGEEKGGDGSSPADEKRDKGEPAEGQEEEDVIWVEWDGPDDPANPLNWSRRRKWLISTVGIVFAGMVSVNVSAYSFSIPSVERELNVSAELAAVGVTFFTLTFGIAPVVLSPLSEVFGRNPIYLISAFMAALWLIPQALAPNIATLLIARLFLGVAGSTGINLIGGTLADVWSGEERGVPMSFFVLSAFGFTGAGPVMFSYAEARYGFRIISWCWFAVSSAFFVAIIPIVKETRATVLLTKKAARLRKETGDERYQTRHDHARTTFGAMMRTALSRPLKILCTEPVVIAFSVWIAFAWGVLYMCLGSIVIVYEGVYGFGVGPTGFIYLTQAIGAGIGLVANKFYFEGMFAKNLERKGPEATLYTAMGGGVLFPLGCWIYATTARASVHWIVPTIGLVILYTGDYLIFLAVYSYLAASYTLYASSALSSMNLLRNVVAAVFPLFTSQMYAKLGVQNAGILTAGLGTGLSVIPFLLFVYGRGLRARSPFAKQLARVVEEERLVAERERERRGRIAE